eukprot:GDKI01035088.1.p2 GENE.GDKI01035088.1~~GDKI01035088.1.p2  ORF type:complete len:253 (-),score=101.33 GDKI01035088.1:119-835(-)
MSKEVAEILANEKRRFDAASIPQLEKCVEEQLASGVGAYNLEANLCLMQLYEMNPSKMKLDVVRKVLLKGLQQLPSTDFTQYLYMLREKHQQAPAVSELVQLHDSLESGRIPEAWTQFNASKELQAVKGLGESMREYVMGVLGATYTTLSLDELAPYLNVKAPVKPEDATVQPLLRSHEWTLEKGEKGEIVVKIPVKDALSGFQLRGKQQAAMPGGVSGPTMSIDSVKTYMQSVAGTV